MRTLAAVLLLALVALGSPATLAGQAQQPVFRGGVEVIEVDVSVVDGRGLPLADLRAPEFTVTVDGRPRQVLSAEFVSLRAKEAPRGPRPLETAEPTTSSNASAPRGRLLILAVDREGIAFGNGRSAMRAAGKFLDKLGPRDRVALITVPPPGPSADFTTNFQAVRRLLERTAGEASRAKGSLDIGVYEAYSINHHSDQITEMAAMTRLCGQLRSEVALQQCQQEVQAQAGMIVQEMERRTSNSLNALRSLLQALRDIEGPKSLVWISEGLSLESPSAEVAEFGVLAAAARTTVNVVLLDAPLTDISEPTPSPSARQDRDMAVRGMEMLAALTGGALLRVSGGAEFVFDRLDNELSGYYLLAVESAPSDKDTKRHPIRVTVGRRGTTVRARRELAPPTTATLKQSPQERVIRTLASPFTATDFPVRMTTFAYQDGNASKVRLVLAAEMGPAEMGPSEKGTANLMTAFELRDGEGRSLMSKPEQTTLTPVRTPAGTVFQHNATLVVEPGEYIVRLAAVDEGGRRASLEHPVKAWQMGGVPFALSDLTVSDAPSGGGSPNGTLQTVESRLAGGELLAYLELYSNQRDYLTDATVRVEVASEESGPALASAPAQLKALGDSNRQVAAVVSIEDLPPGRYVARAIIARGTSALGRLVRPFERLGGGRTAPPLTTLVSAPAPFDRRAAVSTDALGFFMNQLDKGRPALKHITAQVRTGRFEGAARGALDADDQAAAMFLRGLELFAKGDLDQAATQLTNAQRLAPDLGPAAFYLGACYAAAGRDREATDVWLRTAGTADRSSLEFSAIGDALQRLGRPAEAIDPLTRAVVAFPNEDGLRRRLAFVYALGQRPRDALTAIDPYLARHADDGEALLVAMHEIYAAHLNGQAILGNDQDRTKMAGWARAYRATKGAQSAVVDLWAAYVAAH